MFKFRVHFDTACGHVHSARFPILAKISSPLILDLKTEEDSTCQRLAGIRQTASGSISCSRRHPDVRGGAALSSDLFIFQRADAWHGSMMNSSKVNTAVRLLIRDGIMKPIDMNFRVTFSILFLVISPLFAGNANNNTYLALGDSVSFGLNEALLPPFTTNLPTPNQFVGYPEALAALQNLLQPKSEVEVNASCPGETSGSFLDTSVTDNGCNSPHLQPPAPTIPPFKTSIGLHTPYTIAQMDFAEAQFQTNKHINLVTLSIGANDILLVLPALLQCGGNTGCAQGVLGPVLQTYAVNLSQILTRIRAHYQGRLVLLTYYSPAPALDSVAVALNGVMTQVAQTLSAQRNFSPIIIADGFNAFRLASAAFNDDACQAGLLIRFPPSSFTTSPCDIHPSELGRDLLAFTIEAALRFQP